MTSTVPYPVQSGISAQNGNAVSTHQPGQNYPPDHIYMIYGNKPETSLSNPQLVAYVEPPPYSMQDPVQQHQLQQQQPPNPGWRLI